MSVSAKIEGVCFIRELPNDRGQVTFWCPGCDAGHTIQYGDAQSWQWNGNTAAPTFTPSVLALPHQKLNDAGKALVDAGHGSQLTDEHRTTTPRCHSFVTDGRIQYLTDSEHELAGQTVDMVPLPDRYAQFLDG